MRRIIVVAALAVAAGCSSSTEASTPTTATPPSTAGTTTSTNPPCATAFADGVAVASVDQVNRPCADGAQAARVYGAGSQRCADGRTLVWNDLGWAFVGTTWATHPAGLAAKVPPAEVRKACAG